MARSPNSALNRLPMRIGVALALSLTAPAFARDPPPEADEYIVVTGGSVREPANAQWTEDMSLPELPTATDDSAGGK
jgi:hypothetical protein